MREITGEWLAAASLDLETIASIIDNDNLTGIVAFHAQQAMEKTLKAVLEETRIEFPKVHKLQTLFALLPEKFRQDYDLVLIKTLDGLYIEARYPGGTGALAERQTLSRRCKEILRLCPGISRPHDPIAQKRATMIFPEVPPCRKMFSSPLA